MLAGRTERKATPAAIATAAGDLLAINNASMIEPEALGGAIQATFECRDTAIPKEVPIRLAHEFVDDAQKAQQWGAYAASIDIDGLSLDSVVKTIWSCVVPAFQRLANANRDINVAKYLALYLRSHPRGESIEV